MIKVVCFDIGGVMLQSRGPEIYTELGRRLGIPKDTFAVFRLQHHDKLMSGHMSAEEFTTRIRSQYSVRSDILTLWKEAFRRVVVVNERMVELVQILRQNYRTALITNTNSLHANLVRQLGLYDLFDPAVISCNIGLQKPENEIYDFLLQQIGCQPGECIVVDDNKDYLATAQRMGFGTILFQNPRQLQDALREFNVVHTNKLKP